MCIMLEVFDEQRLRDAPPEALGDALENDRIVHFPQCPLPLPPEDDLALLRSELPAQLRLKNVSYHPEAGSVRGLDGDDPALLERVTAILRAHSEQVCTFLDAHMGHLTRDWRVGTCSFRPIQERGRNLKPHASNELVHIDAGAYGATDGDRIFRFFVNVNPDEDRVWATKGGFAHILERFGHEAGLVDAGGRGPRIEKNPLDHAYSGMVAGLARLNPMARMIDSTPYDRAMRRLHNFMKDEPSFRDDMRDYREIRFPPYSAWMVFTDGVSHASLAGQFAFVTTCIVPRRNLRLPERSPWARLAALRAPAA